MKICSFAEHLLWFEHEYPNHMIFVRKLDDLTPDSNFKKDIAYPLHLLSSDALRELIGYEGYASTWAYGLIDYLDISENLLIRFKNKAHFESRLTDCRQNGKVIFKLYAIDPNHIELFERVDWKDIGKRNEGDVECPEPVLKNPESVPLCPPNKLYQPDWMRHPQYGTKTFPYWEQNKVWCVYGNS